MHFLQLIDIQYLLNLPNFQYFQKLLYIAVGRRSRCVLYGSAVKYLHTASFLIFSNEKPSILTTSYRVLLPA